MCVLGLTGVARADADPFAAAARARMRRLGAARRRSSGDRHWRCHDVRSRRRGARGRARGGRRDAGRRAARADGHPVRRRGPVRAPRARAARARRNRAQRRFGAHARRLGVRRSVAPAARPARRRLPTRLAVRAARRGPAPRRPRAARAGRAVGAGVAPRAGGRRPRPVASAARCLFRRDRDRRVPGVGARGRGPAARVRRRARGRPGRDPRAEVVVGEGGDGCTGWFAVGSATTGGARRGPPSSRRPRVAWRPRSTGSPDSTPSRRRRRSTCSGERWSSSSRPRANASVASARACSSVRSASRSAPISTGSSCAGSPRACSRPTPRDDPLLGDPERGVLGGELPLRADRTAANHRALLAALAATTGDRVLGFPRGDLRRSTEHVPVAVPARHGRSPVGSTASSTRARAVVHHDRLVRRRPRPRAVPRDRARARRPDRARRRTVDGDRVPARPRAARGPPQRGSSRGSTATSARSRRACREVGPASADVVVSPTRLEPWARCPHAYFMRYVLRHRPRRTARGDRRAAPIDRGSIVHAVLDRFVAEGGTIEAPRTPARHRRRGVRRVRRARARRAGVSSGCASSGDPRRSSTRGSRPTPRTGPSTACARSQPSIASVRSRLTLPDRAHVALPRRGRPGRRDRRRPAVRVRLQDEQRRTGSTPTIPLEGGTRLQLPVYALAARALAGAAPATPVEAYYWFVGRGEDAWGGYPVDAEIGGAVRRDTAGDRRRHRRRLLPGPARRARARGSSSTASTAIPTASAPPIAGATGPARRARRSSRPIVALDGCDRVTDLQPSLFDPVSSDDAARDRDPERPRRARCSSRRARAPARPRRSSTASSRSCGRRRRRCRAIAAITFTEKAAAELRDRVRAELEKQPGDRRLSRVRSTSSTRPRSARCTRSRSASSPSSRSRPGSRRASRSTTRSRPRSRSTRAGERFVDQLLDDAGARGRRSLLGARGGRAVRAAAARSPRRSTTTGTCSTASARRRALPDARARRVARRARRGVRRNATSASTTTTSMVARLDELAEYARPVAQRASTTPTRSSCCGASKPSFKVGNVGRKDNWRCDLDGPARAHRRARRAAHGDAARRVVDAVIRRSSVALAEFTARRRRRAPRRRRARVPRPARARARRCSAIPSTVRRARRVSRDRYQRLLIDEFQDTDPIQVELAVLLGVDRSRRRRRGRGPRSTSSRVACSSSATRSSRSTGSGAPTSRPSSRRATRSPTRRSCSRRNFRTTEPVLAWINHVFGELIQPVPGSQPEYLALEATRADAAERSGRDAARRRAARATIPTPTRCASAKPPTSSPRSRTAIDEQLAGPRRRRRWRPARLGDICILLPARTSLGFLETRARRRGHPVPGRDELARLRQPRGPRSARRAARGRRPERQLALVDRAALAAVRLRRRRPLRVPRRARRPLGPHAVRRPRRCRPTIRSSTRCGTSRRCTTQRIVADAERAARAHRARPPRARARRRRPAGSATSRGASASSSTRRARSAKRRRARCATTSRGRRCQGTEGARVVETVLPETDDDAVRIMTVHGAKGLEFPIVICSGMTTRAAPRRGGVQVLFPPDRRLRDQAGARASQTDQFELHQPVDEQMGFHEKLRLLYVACTRARDHLVVSVHRKARERSATSRRRGRTPSCSGTPRQGACSPTASRPRRRRAARCRPRGRAAAGSRRRGQDDTRAAFARGAATSVRRRRPRSPQRADAARVPRSRAGEGRSRPRAAAVEQGPLRHRDRARGARGAADRRPRDGRRARRPRRRAGRGRRCARSRSDDRRARAVGARERDRACAACRDPYWRETYVAVPVEGITLEGYVDLVYRDDDGPRRRRLQDRRGRRRRPTSPARWRTTAIQGAAYALAVGGRRRASPSSRACSCSSIPAGAREVAIAGDRPRRRDRRGPSVRRRGAPDAPSATRPRRCSPNA